MVSIDWPTTGSTRRCGEDDAAEPNDLAPGARIAVENRLGEQGHVGTAVGLAGDEQALRRNLGMPFDEMDERAVPLVDAGLDVARQRIVRREGQAHAERMVEDQVVGGVVPSERAVGERAVGIDRVWPVLGEETPEAGRARPSIRPQDGRDRFVGVLHDQPVEQPVLAGAVAKHVQAGRVGNRDIARVLARGDRAVARQRLHPVVRGGGGRDPPGAERASKEQERHGSTRQARSS